MTSIDFFSPHRFCEFIELTADEREGLALLHGPVMRVERGQVIRRSGESVHEVFFLIDGWVISSLDLPEGERQIVKVHLPGDMLGSPSMTLEAAAETLTAITPVVVSRVSLSAIGRLFTTAPRLAAALFMSVQQERVILMDRIASLGRSTASQRLAAFLLHMYDRMRVRDPAQGLTLSMPLTQENIGDITGLTAVHVNRTLRQFDEDGLVLCRRQSFTILDLPKLRKLSALPERQWARRPAWLEASLAAVPVPAE